MFLILILITAISVIIHEYFHGWTASKLEDPTPKDNGRLTLNPLRHIDLFGTIILPILILAFSKGLISFGYAKPIPINFYRFRKPKKDIMWVGIAAPLVNFIIALFLILVFKTIKAPQLISEIIIWSINLNLIIAIFNLLPIPPLDGSKIIASLLPSRLSFNYLKMETIGFFSIISFTILGGINWFLLPLSRTIMSFFMGEHKIF